MSAMVGLGAGCLYVINGFSLCVVWVVNIDAAWPGIGQPAAAAVTLGSGNSDTMTTDAVEVQVGEVNTPIVL